MKLVSQIFTPAEDMDSLSKWSTEVEVTDEEWELIEQEDDEAIYQLFEVAGTHQPHYRGPGQPFMQQPSYSVRKNGIVTVNQYAGWDV